MLRMILHIVIIKVLVSKRIYTWQPSITERLINRAKASWETLGFGSQSMIQNNKCVKKEVFDTFVWIKRCISLFSNQPLLSSP